jgi:copper homeostasis protein CutC
MSVDMMNDAAEMLEAAVHQGCQNITTMAQNQVWQSTKWELPRMGNDPKTSVSEQMEPDARS